MSRAGEQVATLLDHASLATCRQLFAEAAAPTPLMLAGRHRARFVGPTWWRGVAPTVVAALGMPGWWGKAFRLAPDGALVGHNLLLRRGRLVRSFPMRATLAASRVDGRPALVIRYPAPAPWQWRQVTDELRPLAPGTLVGLTFVRVPVVPAGLPFRLDRDDAGADAPA